MLNDNATDKITTAPADDKKTAAAKKREKETPRRTFTKNLRIPLTQDERNDRAAKLAEEGDLIVSLENQKAAEAKRIGGDIAQAQGRAAALRFVIRDQHEMRPIECYELWVDGVMQTRRCDTDEVVGARPCPQRPLGIDEMPSGIDDTREVDDDGNEKKKRKAKR